MRAQLAMLMMDSLRPPAWQAINILSAAERRDAEIESGEVVEMDHEAFIAGLRTGTAA